MQKNLQFTWSNTYFYDMKFHVEILGYENLLDREGSAKKWLCIVLHQSTADKQVLSICWYHRINKLFNCLLFFLVYTNIKLNYFRFIYFFFNRFKNSFQINDIYLFIWLFLPLHLYLQLETHAMWNFILLGKEHLHVYK